MKTLMIQLSCCMNRVPHNYLSEHDEFEMEHYYDRDDDDGDREFEFFRSQRIFYSAIGATIIQTSIGWDDTLPARKPVDACEIIKRSRPHHKPRRKAKEPKIDLPPLPPRPPLCHILGNGRYLCGQSAIGGQNCTWVDLDNLKLDVRLDSSITCPVCRVRFIRVVDSLFDDQLDIPY